MTNKSRLWVELLSVTQSRFIRYVLVGVLSAILEWSLLIFFVELFDIDYLISNIFAFLLVQLVNYVLSRNWVFEPSGNRKRKEFALFMLFVFCGLAINQVALWIFVDSFHVRYEISKAIAIALVVVWNFFTRRLFVFKPVSKD